MRRTLFASLLGLAALVASAANSPSDPREVLLGTWKGSSICTNARSACHDETVVYHVIAAAKADTVTVAMNKVVDGKELEMGTIDFTVDFAAHRMVGDVANSRVPSRWTFTFTKTEMKGTAVLLPSGDVGRNIAVHR
jgi:hypothetical protein